MLIWSVGCGWMPVLCFLRTQHWWGEISRGIDHTMRLRSA
jgi:hypothetical protein